MTVLTWRSPSFAALLPALDRRYSPSADLQQYVAGIVTEIATRGDDALLKFAAEYDGAHLTVETLAVPLEEMRAAAKALPRRVKQALAASYRNVFAFSKMGLRRNWRTRNAQGAVTGEVYQPFQRVGIYIPGGTAPLVSTVLMTVTLARAAGVPQIAVCTPCDKSGHVNAALLGALSLTGATEVYRVGGAHAVAALTFGTRTIRPVDKIFGPGNRFVVEAKRQLFGTVGIDLLPGPSEIMVIADESARPAFVAADLLAQAEHGHDSKVMLATPSSRLLKSVEKEIERQLPSLPRSAIARTTLDTGAWLLQTRDLHHAATLCNAWAPEHLSLVVRDEAKILPLIRTAGAIFLGNYSPVAAGDFLAGPSHTLPTGGAGKSFPGLTVDQFQRRTSVVKLSRAALAKSAPVIATFSEIEGLEAHGRSATIRLE